MIVENAIFREFFGCCFNCNKNVTSSKKWGLFLRQFQCVPTTYVTEIKETYFEIYTKNYPVHWFSFFKHLKLPT